MKTSRLQAQLEEMESYSRKSNECNSAVSQASVGWHLAHNLKVIHSILKALENSDPQQYKRSFSWKKELVFLTGRIPRGRARAPKNVIPDENFSESEFEERISWARKKISEISMLPKSAFFDHPFFGHVTKDETPKFLVIHTEHHLKIIREILRGKVYNSSGEK